jgi:hypothetical protein
MKTQLSLQQLATEITRRAEKKEDFIADTRSLAYVPERNELLATDSGRSFVVNDHAHGQIAEHTKIPNAYYKRMRDEAPELLGQNVRQWFDKYPAQRMLRTLDGTARAFLSDKYSRMDDDAFAQVVLPAIYDVPGAEVVSAGMTDLRTTIKMKSARFTRDVKVGDSVQFGVSFSNSEVGSGRLVGSLFAYRLMCLNGMVIEDEQFAATHVGRKLGSRDLGEIFQLDTVNADSKATILKLRDFSREVLTDSFIDAQVDRMRGLTEIKVGDPVKAIEKLAKRHSFTEGQSSSVLQHLITGGDLSMWGLANAITRTAEDQENYDDATRFEAMGGRMLALPKAEYSELLAA